jgi:hypothetical protein
MSETSEYSYELRGHDPTEDFVLVAADGLQGQISDLEPTGVRATGG